MALTSRKIEVNKLFATKMGRFQIRSHPAHPTANFHIHRELHSMVITYLFDAHGFIKTGSDPRGT